MTSAIPLTVNAAKTKLRDGGIAIGTMVSEARTEDMAYVLAAAGFDFFVIDTEHGTASLETVQRMSRGALSAGIAPIVRVPEVAYAFIARTLDAGALGLLAPHVDTAAQARDLVRSAKFRPVGERGYGLRAAVLDYRAVPVADGIEWSNRETLLMAQIESQQSLDNLEDIASVPGIDVLLVGPSDLSISLGVPGQLLHPTMQAAYRRVSEVAGRHGLAAGLHPPDFNVVEYGRSVGMRCLMYSNDVRMLLGAARQAVETLRAEVR